MLLPLVRALHIAATMLVAGAIGFEFLILRRAAPVCDRVVGATLGRWLDRQCAAGLALGLLSWAGWLAALAISMSGLPPAEALTPEILRTVVSRTTFGHVWIARAGLMLAAAAALAWRRRARRADDASAGLADAALAFSLVLSLAWTGHALGAPPGSLALDAAHALAASLWLGMIPPLWLAIRRAGAPGWPGCAIRMASCFSLPGAIAVAVLAGSGVANASGIMGSPAELVTTPYGRLLTAKLTLFALMLLLAARNGTLARRLSASPDVGGRSAGMQQLRRSVSVELACGVVVIAIVGILGATAPPEHDHPMHGAHPMEP